MTFAGLLVLDRDGTLIEEKHYLSNPEDVVLLPGVVEGLKAFREQGWGLVIVTNQSGIGRGYYTTEDFDAVQARLMSLLAEASVTIDGSWHCPHTPDDQCACRKPSTGMLDAACAQFQMRVSDCLVVGDKECDIALGALAGGCTALVRTGYGKTTEERRACEPDLIVDDLAALARWVLQPVVLTPKLASKSHITMIEPNDKVKT